LTANRDLFNASVRHQVRVRKYAVTEAVIILAILEGADRDLVKFLRDRLAAMDGRYDLKSRHWKDLLDDVRTARRGAFASAIVAVTSDLRNFSAVEIAAEVAALKAAIPFEIKVASANLQDVWSTTAEKPFAGGFLRDWFKNIAEQDQRSIQTAVQMGITQGEPIPDIMRRVAGSKENAFRDGTLAVTRRKVESVVRTAVNHVSNEAREAVWEANEDIIAALRWTSVLDGRTTMICMARDGQLAPIGGKPLPVGSVALDPPDARPPAHWNCRSVMTAVIDGEGALGTRPFVRDTRTRQTRETDFRAEARATGRPIQEIRSDWADENIGQASGPMTYQDWLTDQPAKFQDEVLGPSRAEMFRSGSLSLDQFVDPIGRTLTLKQLGDLP
jgi:hypothetical protein